MKAKKHRDILKKIIIGYYILATAIIIICIGIVVYDIIVFYKTGEFSLFRSLNTVKYQTIDESWNYVITENLDSVYLRSSQNSQPNSDASDVNSRKERGRVFRIARSDPPPAF